jgi:serine protease AprX
MKTNQNTQIASGIKERPPNSPAFSAAWGRALGLALLMLSAMPSHAGTIAKPNSVVWGKVPVPPPTVVSQVVSLLNGDGSTADATRRLAPEFQPSTPGGVWSGVKGGGNMVTVIVQYRQMPTSAHLQSLQNGGAAIRSKFHSIRAVTMRIPVSMVAELANNPNVAYISPDRPVSLTSSNEDFTTAVEADVAASQFALDGTGVGVAVIDSGVADHADLHNASGASRVVYSQSFVPGDTTTPDKFGHGTHVAGLIGGSGVSSGVANGYLAKYAGVAPNVNIINLRVLDQNGSGTDSQVIAAIQQAIALKNTYNIRVISMSLGRPVFESYTLDPVDQAVEAAWQAGIVVVVAGGNRGRDNSMGTHGFATIGVPGNDPAVITVGATRTFNTATRVDDAIASYSSKGPTLVDHLVKPDIVAPGNRLVSLLASGSTLDKANKSLEIGPAVGTPKYLRLSGTSMATPLVSGAIALMLQQNPALTPDQVKARLMKTAWKGFNQYTSSLDNFGTTYSNQYDIFTYGAGYLDVDAALNNTDLATGVALSPTAVHNSSDGTVSLINTNSVVWGSTSVVWGATSVVWGNSVVWGANTIQGTSVVWGSTSVVWGANSISGFSVVWGATSTTVSPMSAFSDGDDGEN